MKKYRYILCGVVNMTDKVRDFKLIGLNNVLTDQGIRVEIPDDMELTKYSCDNYSTTDDGRTIQELNPDARVKIDGRWRSIPELLNHQPHEWYQVLRTMDIYGTTQGYMTKEKYKNYCQELRQKAEKEMNLCGF